jgi:hypothetical protein
MGIVTGIRRRWHRIAAVLKRRVEIRFVPLRRAMQRA